MSMTVFSLKMLQSRLQRIWEEPSKTTEIVSNSSMLEWKCFEDDAQFHDQKLIAIFFEEGMGIFLSNCDARDARWWFFVMVIGRLRDMW